MQNVMDSIEQNFDAYVDDLTMLLSMPSISTRPDLRSIWRKTSEPRFDSEVSGKAKFIYRRYLSRLGGLKIVIHLYGQK